MSADLFNEALECLELLERKAAKAESIRIAESRDVGPHRDRIHEAAMIVRTFISLSETDPELEAQGAAYAERNQLVAFLTRCYPSILTRHPDEDTAWEGDWRWIVAVEGPHGQMTWHIHDSELKLFDHLEKDFEFKWDGHDTEEKYHRLSKCGRTHVR